MLASVNKSWQQLASRPPANEMQIASALARYPHLPQEYLSLVRVATDIEFQHLSGKYLRIWGPVACLERGDANEISQRIAGAIPVADDGGNRAIFYLNGKNGFGLYRSDFGDLDAEDAVFVTVSLAALLEKCEGLDAL